MPVDTMNGHYINAQQSEECLKPGFFRQFYNSQKWAKVKKSKNVGEKKFFTKHQK